MVERWAKHCIGLLTGALASSSQSASAQEIALHQVAAVEQGSRGDVGSKASQRFVMPSGQVAVRGELAFLMSDPVITPDELKFGDLALFRPSARRSFGDHVELSLATTLLAKEPKDLEDWLWQGASFAALVEPWSGYAFSLALGGGPQLGGNGSVWAAAPGCSAKWRLDRETRLLLSLKNVFTALDETGRMRPRAWLDELALGGEAQFGDRHGGGWLGVDYSIPLAHAGEVAALPAAVPLDPSVHLDVQLGGVVQVGDRDQWGLFAYYAWIDRGESRHPETLLPVLDGGFDQQQIVIGVTHRFEPPEPEQRRRD